MLIGNTMMAQEKSSSETFGNTLNLGVGVGYYGYNPTLHMNYEINVGKNFTLAPFLSYYSYRNHTKNIFGVTYYYHETAIPIGLKGTYYFDELLNANSDWDFYLGASLGFAIINSTWDAGYTGTREKFNGASPFFINLHVGSEYHINNRLGIFLDLSNGLSTFGLAIHTSN